MAVRSRRLLVAASALVLGALLAQGPATVWPIGPEDHEALAAAVRVLTGRPIEPRYACGHAAPGFADVVVLGTFAHDLGCAILGVVVAGRPLDLARGTALGLSRQGWGGAAPAERGRLALAWTQRVLLAFNTPLEQAPEAFTRGGTPAFTAAAPLPDGGVRVELWIQDPNGMLPQLAYSRIAYTFAANGAVGERERIEGFQVPLGR
jgi:hypothetical protein